MSALRRADSVYSARVRAIYVPLGQFLAQGHGGAGKAELDSVQATQKLYWKIFWEQPEVADSFVTPSQRELIPLFKSMLGVPKEQREHPVPVRAAGNVGGSADGGAAVARHSKTEHIVPKAGSRPVARRAIQRAMAMSHSELRRMRRGHENGPSCARNGVRLRNRNGVRLRFENGV
jgi:hypothetical protein